MSSQEGLTLSLDKARLRNAHAGGAWAGETEGPGGRRRECAGGYTVLEGRGPKNNRVVGVCVGTHGQGRQVLK